MSLTPSIAFRAVLLGVAFESAGTGAEPGAGIGSADPALVAPGVPELMVALARAEAMVVRADALETAVARLQNELAERIPASPGPRKASARCDDASFRSLATRAALFGTAWRDEAQSLVAELARVRRMRDAPTVAPLVDAPTAARVDDIGLDATRLARAYLEAVSWQRDVLAPFAPGCDGPVEPASGVSDRVPRAPNEVRAAVAVAVTDGGRVCPDAAPGPVWVVLGGAACYGSPDGACACEPVAVLPGAVLGSPGP